MKDFGSRAGEWMKWVRKGGSSVLPGARSDVYNEKVFGVREITFA